MQGTGAGATAVRHREALTRTFPACSAPGADIPAALSGTLNFVIRNGELDAKKPGPMSRFSSLSASGALSKGILTTRDLNLSGGLSVRGQGQHQSHQQNAQLRLERNRARYPGNSSTLLRQPRRAAAQFQRYRHFSQCLQQYRQRSPQHSGYCGFRPAPPACAVTERDRIASVPSIYSPMVYSTHGRLTTRTCLRKATTSSGP